MLAKLRLKDNIYQGLSLFFIIVLAVAVPTSRLLMSISEIALFALFLWNGNWRAKWQAFVSNRIAVVLVVLFLWHIVGGFYSQDSAYLLKDLRTKLPMLLLPLVFSALPRLKRSTFLLILLSFIASVVYASVFVSVEHLITRASITHIMGDRFVSHIRFGLNLDVAIFYLVIIWMLHKPTHVVWYILYVVVLLWLLFSMLYLKAFTTLVVFGMLLFVVILIYAIRQKHTVLRISVISILLLSVVATFVYLYTFVRANTAVSDVDVSSLDTHTAYGTPYTHKPGIAVENGQQVWLYVAESEMAAAWNERSALAYDGKDKRQQHLRFTLVRYLSSKGLRKDRNGVMQLSVQDVENIENGIANVHYTRGLGVKARLYKILFEYENYKLTADPSGHSVMQRIEFWKTAWHIIKQHPIVGVGTGDANRAFSQAYVERHSKLAEEFRYRSHNQYLSICVTLGVVGLIVMLFSLIYPLYIKQMWKNPFYMVFFLVFIISMFSEDTLESQAGLTFYAFFNSFLLLIAPTFKALNPIDE